MMANDTEFVKMSVEDAALIRHQHDIDYEEAGPKAASPWRMHGGVKLTSRWGVERELVEMQRIVDALPDLIRHRLTGIWCDSNAQATYSVEVKPMLWAPEIEWALRQAINAATVGHNGTDLIGSEGQYARIEPDWGEF